jgi:hypothetical protein
MKALWVYNSVSLISSGNEKIFNLYLWRKSEQISWRIYFFRQSFQLRDDYKKYDRTGEDIDDVM